MQGFGILDETTLRQARQGGASPDIVSAVRRASASTGVDFSYLMEKAAVESGFKADAKAVTSSATGLYQFTDSTWLSMVAQHGAAHGLGGLASEIDTCAGGAPTVADAAERQKILDLRNDPTAAAAMAAELARDNKAQLETTVGGKIGGTELYLAHFLGAAGAAKFLAALRADSNQPAAGILPNAASSNPGVFTDSATGQPCTLAQIYDRFAAHFGKGEAATGENNQVACPAPAEPAPSTPTAIAIAQAPASWPSAQNPPERAIPGIGGPTLSLYAILALAALDLPGGAQESGNKKDALPLGMFLSGI